ncbi:DUF1289 domain-containing protein [Tropicimonas sp. TH_r6]|uniref:DUF1289 domain-containing protein n=1 Tax=Tropicimonas sp. TH_r6 TaxID=3082085 RepID=UPI0029555848|nr:DUF1289 domain-containing protein [Tropicimonas sp. TH_r6]MDV7142634.1 DUF1289 domain-containing protein [Tropicimonas sp. TH_r6]
MKDDDLWKRDEVASPCNKVCVIHPEARICAGCYRTMDEIASWGRLSAQARTDLIEELPSRAGLLKQRRGGRKARRADG